MTNRKCTNSYTPEFVKWINLILNLEISIVKFRDIGMKLLLLGTSV